MVGRSTSPRPSPPRRGSIWSRVFGNIRNSIGGGLMMARAEGFANPAPGHCSQRGNRCSFSWGRIALLACAQRHISVSRAHIPTVCHRRKPLPKSIKTLGDLIQIKRYEKRLTVEQIARKMGIATRTVRAWERGESTPDQEQWQLLSVILSFDSGILFPKHIG